MLVLTWLWNYEMMKNVNSPRKPYAVTVLCWFFIKKKPPSSEFKKPSEIFDFLYHINSYLKPRKNLVNRFASTNLAGNKIEQMFLGQSEIFDFLYHTNSYLKPRKKFSQQIRFNKFGSR
jgi:hypothetical protein